MKLLKLLNLRLLAVALAMLVAPFARSQTVPPCTLPSGPLCYTVNSGTDSIWDVIPTSFAGGSSLLTNGVAVNGWCLRYDRSISSDLGFEYCSLGVSFTDQTNSPSFPSSGIKYPWNQINYIINQSGVGPYTAAEVQAAIWIVVQDRLGLARPFSLPLSIQLANEAVLAVGNGPFVPLPGQKLAAYVDMGEDFAGQPIFIEVVCGGPPPPPPLEQCAQEAVGTPSINNNASYAFALGALLGNDFITGPQSLKLISNPDGSLILTGVVVRASNPNLCFNASITFSGPTSTAPAGYPQKLIGTADSSSWTYYTSVSGTLVGQKGLTGTNLFISASGAQFGFGANNNNLLNGYFSQIKWGTTLATVNNDGVLAGQIIECPDVDQICLNQALPVSGVSGGHAFYLPGIGTDFIAGSVPLKFVESSNGKGSITGVVFSASNPCKSFIVDIALSGLTSAGPGSPKLELPNSYYVPPLGTGIVDTNGWHYYSNMVGTLTGVGCFAGGQLKITNMGPSPQFGIGANGKNINDGGSAWFTVTVVKSPTTGPAFCPTSHGDFNLDTAPCVEEEICVKEAFPALVSGGHALYLPGIGTDFIASSGPLKLTKYEDGTALLSGNVYKKSNTNQGFAIKVNLSGLVEPPAPAPSGSAKLELPASAYLPTGPVDTNTWTYYTAFSGTLTGLGQYAGGSIAISRMGPSFQLGYGASGKNTNDGGSGWFTVTVVKNPTCGITFCPTSHGDFNLDITPCTFTPPPPPPCPVKPSNLVLSINAQGKVVVTWKDNSSNESGFIVERKTGANGSWVALPGVAANATTYTDTTVAICTTYCYRVRTSNCAEYTAEACITTPQPCPNPPSNLVLSSVVCGKVVLCWKDNSSGESCFQIERKTGTGSWVKIGQVAANCTSFTDTTVEGGKTYTYRIRTCECADYSNEVCTTPPTAPPVTCGGDGLKGYYFNSKDLTCLKFSRVDSTINFDWGNGSPSSSLGADCFSVRWTGQIQAEYSQTYTFYVNANNGYRLWVNGTKIIDLWGNTTTTETSGTIALVAGKKYDIKLEYYENTGTASAKLSWSSASLPKQIVSKCVLYSGGYTGKCDVSVPWQVKNIGNCAKPGEAKECTGDIYVSGSGSDIWGSNDECHKVFQNAVGDCEIKAKICSVGNTDPWAKCGVMIRESLNGNSSHAFMCLTAGNGIAFQRRNGTGAASEHTSGGNDGSCWVKLVRRGNTFTSYKSKDGSNWTKVGSCNIPMASNCYIGLAVTSHNSSLTSECKVSNVTVIP